MNNLPTHLLATLGVLASFSIAKRVEKQQIRKTLSEIKKSTKEKDKKILNKLLEDKLASDVNKNLNEKLPPGVIVPSLTPKQEELNKMYTDLLTFSNAICSKLKEKNMSKHSLCFIINALINLLQLTENDFDEFNDKFNKFKNGEIEDE